MKKNKTIAYMLATTLLVGGTFAGTKAWFSETGTVENGLIVKMGSFDLDIIENMDEVGKEGPEGWVHYRNGKPEEIKTDKNGNKFTNIKPGDQFIRTITFKNNGTLNQRVFLDTSKFEGKVPSGFIYNKNMGGFPGGVQGSTYKDIRPGEEATIKLSIQVSKDMEKEGFSGQEFDMNFGQIGVRSTQINEGLDSNISVIK